MKAPSYLTVLSNRTINEIADINTLRRTQTGLARILLPQEIGPDIADSIRRSVIRILGFSQGRSSRICRRHASWS